MRAIWNDLRFGVRLLWASPGFTLVAVLTLALGIAVNTTVFSWIDTLLLRPIPGAHADHELAMFETVTASGEYLYSSYPDYRDLRDRLRLVSGLTAIFNTPLRIGEGDDGQEIAGELVTGNFFKVLGVQPFLGRFFTSEEAADPPAVHPVAVLSYNLWRTRFHLDHRVIGRTIFLNRYPLTVIGVAPPEFAGSASGIAYDIWAPLPIISQLNRAPEGMLANRQTRNLALVARLKPGVMVEQAGAEASACARELALAYPKQNEGIGVSVVPLWQAHIGAGAVALLRWPLQLLMAVCGIVLLIVCANVANLLLARATARQKEFGIRLSLGAGRGRLARQLLTETFIVAGAGAVIGLLLAPWMAESLRWLIPPVSVRVRMSTGLNTTISAFTLLVCVAATLISGLAPLLCSLRPDLNETLKEGGRSEKSGGRSHRMRALLVVAEVALAAVALICAGLFAKSFQAARTIHPGFDPNQVLVARFSLANTGYSLQQQHQLCLRLRRRFEGVPAFTNVSYADIAPLGFDQGPWQDLQIEGYVPREGENMRVYRSLIAPGYFDVLRIPRRLERDVTDRYDAQAEPVMMVNEAFTRRFFAGADPIGRKVRAWGRWWVIIDVVKDVRYHNLAGAPEPYFYTPFRQAFSSGLNTSFFIRTAGDPTAAIATVRREAAAVDPSAEILEIMPLAEFITESLFALKVAASMLAALGVLSVVLAGVGLYSVMAYAVEQRTHELGVRMALGAQRRDVLRMVVRQGLELTAAGLAAGLFLALLVTRLMAGLLVKVSAGDPAIFGAAALFLAVVAVLASYLPARRATKVEPMIALRTQ